MIYLADLKLPKIESPEFSRFPITSLPIVLILLLFIGDSTIVFTIGFCFLLLRLNSPCIHPDLQTKGPPGNVTGCIYF